MSAALVVGIAAVVAAGVFLALSRNVLRVVVGISLLGSAVNLLLFASGRLDGQGPPIIEPGGKELVGAANPLPQAFVLTAIVIGFALVCFSLVLALAAQQTSGQADTDEMRLAEPPADEKNQPPPVRQPNVGDSP